jgi:hypothetical protein
MQTNKPPPPPGRPTIQQRVSAIHLATRAHSSPKGKMLARGQALILSDDNHSSRTKSKSESKAPIPSMISCCGVDEMDDPHFCKSARPRFMRWKNQDKYPRKEEEDEIE